jgi:hypothetical protein
MKFLMAIVLVAFSMQGAYAYFDKTDRAEWVEIGGNQSAFMLPMVGDNKDKQKQFGSLNYLNDNKVGAKRVQIPHVKADNTGTFTDYYVSSHKLYLVDRTPYAREWVDAHDRGTSNKKEGFRFESADSVNIGTGITIAAYVTEEDAAKFFYHFGTQNVATGTSSTDPQSQFASVGYGRSLAEIMDTVVRAKVQATLAKEFGRLKFKDAILAKAKIIDTVESSVKAEFASKGITISFIGYAESLSFDDNIQNAINQVVIADFKYMNKDALMAVTDIDERNAKIGVTNATSETMKKWNGQINLPSFMIISEKFTEMFSGWFGNKTEQSVKK